jgi:hypothetical protein
MFTTILTYAALFSAGLIAGLKVIAPLTKTTVDDTVLGYLEDLEKIVESLGGKLPEAPAALKA